MIGRETALRGPALHGTALRRTAIQFGAAALALGWLLVLPVALPRSAAPVGAHSGLVAVMPPEDSNGALRLVFSEALEGRFSGADLVASDGTTVSVGVGHLDPADPRVMLVAEPVTSAGAGLSVAWRALSAADGHVTTGSFPVPGAAGQAAGPGTPTRGHSPGHLSLEALAKILAFGGLLLALGLLPFGRLVVRPVTGAVPRGLILTQANALIAASVGGALLLAVTELELAAAGTVVDPLTYVAGNRVGALLALRAAVPFVGGLLTAVFIRRGAVGQAGELAAAVSLVALVLTALSGHAAAYASPAPVAVDLVHLVAASVWLAGLVGLAGLIGAQMPISGATLRVMIPRFSGLALASVALLGLTGLYAAWLETEDWTSVAPPYSLALAVKVVVVGAAFAVGALNYLDGGRDLRIGGGLARRIMVEAGIAVVVVVATASLTSGDPPSLTRPIPIAPVTADGIVSLALAPGRPGPDLIVVGGPVPVGASVQLTPLGPSSQEASGTLAPLVLGPLDALPGAAAARAREMPGGHVGATVSIPAGRWEAAVVVGGVGEAIARFDFGVDDTGVTAGREAPPLPPPLVAGVGLVLLALLGAGLLARGLVPPLVERHAGRASLAAVTILGGALGVTILALGPLV